MAGGELRRSYTQMDFSLNRVNHSVRPNMPHMFQQPPIHQVRGDPRRRFSAMPAHRMKYPTLDIYRPPSLRFEGANGMATAQRSLNVHAPEFTMDNNKIQPSRSTSSVMMNGYGVVPQGYRGGVVPIQSSKSTANVPHVAQTPNTTAQVAPRAVHFKDVVDAPRTAHSGLKRSKSLSSADTLSTSPIPAPSPDLGSFTPEVQAVLQQAIKDPNDVPARPLMALAKHIVERAVSDRRYAEPAAKICINLIENEKKETFLESLLNTCQLTYQEREKMLRNQSIGSRYRQYMTFLNEMFIQLKRSQLQLKTRYDGVAPQMLLLTLLSKCFMDCLQVKPLSKIEVESIFFILPSIGKDVQQNLPKAMDQIMFSMRSAFFATTTHDAIKNTLMQLIELRASNWQLPASAVMYYYPQAQR